MELENAIAEFGDELPPGTEGRVCKADDIDLSNLEMFRFTERDGDGNFAWDESNAGWSTLIGDTLVLRR